MLTVCSQVLRTIAAGAVYLTAFAAAAAISAACLFWQPEPMIFHAVYRPDDWNLSDLWFVGVDILLAAITVMLAVGVARIVTGLLFGGPSLGRS